ncbi:MAG TPA: Uma2 family endonuclease [Candidatus Kapabacteria bacterium]|nr:Uma2 family endonuclease [Candidatus Kapabacteria bacterium]
MEGKRVAGASNSTSRKERKTDRVVFILMLTLQDELKTVADYTALPDDGEQYELIAGEIIMVPSPTTFHQDILTNLMGELYPIVRSRKLGKILPSPVNVFATGHDVYQRTFFSCERRTLRSSGWMAFTAARFCD